MYKISVCTVCMNRLHHLRETVPANIADNLDYPYLEHIILDYNSGDGMEEWARDALGAHIASGRVKYYKTLEPDFFNLSHSKNMVARLGTGDIICLVDADNYSGHGYTAWVNRVFEENGGNTILTTLRKNFIPFRDQGGKLAFSRNLFSGVKGFDESLVGYGIDDIDLVNRLEMAGGSRFFINNEAHLKFIGHSNGERLENHHLINNLENIFIECQAGENRQHVLYLMKDNSFRDVDFIFEESLKGDIFSSYGGWRIRNDVILEGRYRYRRDGLLLSYQDSSTVRYEEEDSETLFVLTGAGKLTWRRVQEESELHFHLVMSYGECFNRIMFEQNNECKKLVNPSGWGQGNVYLNFDYDRLITL